jgi:PhnB protein
MAFYEKAFGFTKHFAVPDDTGKTMHGEMKYQDIVIMMSPEGNNGCPVRSPATSNVPSPVGLYVYCDDVDALCKRAEAAGAKVTKAPEDMFWGDRMATLTDPDGHTWNFATHVGKKAG